MSNIDDLVAELRETNRSLTLLIETISLNQNQWYTLPNAAKILGINYNKFRSLCIEGVIPCAMSNDNPKMRHYLVDVFEARRALQKGGYMRLVQQTGKKRGRKSKINII